MSAVEQVRTFLSEVKTETKKISWPSWESLKGSTGVVIVTVFVITVFISIIDLILNRVVDFLMRVG